MKKRLYQHLNSAGGLMFEFVNAATSLIIAIKNNDKLAADLSFKNLDQFELEKHKQNDLIIFAQNDTTPGIKTIELHKLLNSFLVA